MNQHFPLVIGQINQGKKQGFPSIFFFYKIQFDPAGEATFLIATTFFAVTVFVFQMQSMFQNIEKKQKTFSTTLV